MPCALETQMHTAAPVRCTTKRASAPWLLPAAALLAVLALLGSAGQSDLEAEQAEEAHYCSMVRDGYWPAYDDAIQCPAVAR